uniref:PABS domain-containing protein n=1 Tax=Heterosigma akashiwo TaxID=2829 RepID=A0A6V1NMD1_HETAK
MDAMKNAKDKVKETLTGVKNAPGVKNGWFSESEVMWPGQKFSLQVEEVVFHQKSDYQDVLVFKSSTYGMVLVLDGVIQLTERDEFAYQEMITHLPMFAHPNPKKVLIIGGGDGGVLREVVKHPTVEKIDMCEIDDVVIQCAKDYFGESTATAYADPRLNLVQGDAAEYIRREGHERYDVIVCDSSDPVGPAESLFQPAFYEAMANALEPGGITCTQGECQWLHLELIEKVVAACASLFNQVEYGYTTIPTYPSGQIGFVLCSNNPQDGALTSPRRAPPAGMALRYYRPAVHRAAFVLPAFAHAAVQRARAKGGLPARDNEDEEAVAGGGGCIVS